jgi:hypothetical protein
MGIIMRRWRDRRAMGMALRLGRVRMMKKVAAVLAWRRWVDNR